MNRITISGLLFAIAPFFGAFAQTTDSVDEARFLIKNGEPQTATEMLRRLSAKFPKKAEIDRLLGESLLAEGKTDDAVEAFRLAVKKGDNDARLDIAQILTLAYRPDDAEAELQLYRKALVKGRKSLPDNSGDVADLLMRIRNMLSRVEQITIIDSVDVDADDFLKFFRLAKAAGSVSSLASNDYLSTNAPTVYTTSDLTHRIFPKRDTSDAPLNLVEEDILLDGSTLGPTPIFSAPLDGDSNYPFLLTDGMTLYFANDGESSLGGYDIYVARRGPDGSFMQPQNIGMPYNSPDNDFMLAIDESRNIGWWATDRNHHPGLVTIYTFIPSEIRTNVSTDNPDKLASLALVNDYRLTWGDKDFSRLAADARNFREKDAETLVEIPVNIPGVGFLTSPSMFRSKKTLPLVSRLKEISDAIEANNSDIASLRLRFANGDTDVADQIKALSDKSIQLNDQFVGLRNQIVSEEQQAR